jgi:amidophosphoribosyltransferase
VAGIIAICNFNKEFEKEKLIYNVFRGMQLLQHRGKAFWKINSGQFNIEGYGVISSFNTINKMIKKQKNILNTAIGYLSKKKPKHRKYSKSSFALDGFFIDIDKLPTHPLIKNKKNIEPLYQIYFIFKELLESDNPYRAAEFLDRHLRGNYATNINDKIYVFRNSTGFKPLFIGESKREQFYITISENYIENFFDGLKLRHINPGQLTSIDLKDGIKILTQLDRNRILMDPFEFLRESHVSSIFNDKSIYTIRKNIGKLQAEFLSKKNIDTDMIYAEPDYARPMALGFNIEYKNKNNFEMLEGIIKDRYDDSDHMIDYSEQVSKNKLLSNGKTLKFIIEPLTENKNITSIQGTIQTGGTVIETIFYLRKAHANKINIVVSSVPTIDGRQVGLYTQQRDLIARKYIGKIAYIDDLNDKISSELGADKVYYNSPEILSKGIGMPESQLWFPEWIRFLDYK